MKKNTWQIALGQILVILSVVVYCIHYLIFHDFHHIFIYFIGDVGFVFIEVLLVTLIIHKVLEERDRKSRLKKQQVIIGAFFSDVGTELIGFLSEFNPSTDDICDDLTIDNMWTDKKFQNAIKFIKRYQVKIECKSCDFDELKLYPVQKKEIF